MANAAKNTVLTLCGIAFLMTGIVLVLREWASLVIVFKGVIGGLMAVLGLFILFLVSGKSGKA
jgi:hypothetical protein